MRGGTPIVPVLTECVGQRQDFRGDATLASTMAYSMLGY
jgi:hypothetical protein